MNVTPKYSPPIQLEIMSSLKGWISDKPIPPFPGDTTDKLDRITALAHTEQSLIGWTQAFKGRLSNKWTTAQGLWYDHMRHNLPSSEKFPKRYTGPIWMKKLVAQLIYYNLNRWQIRNEAAQAAESAEEHRKNTGDAPIYNYGFIQVKQHRPRPTSTI